MKKRDGFNKMISDALDGKIDLIVTKSVSRFARNTVDTLTNVRKLKEKGIEVFFEKENIYTLDSKGELLITIMSSLAQQESRSMSENIKWGHQKRFADGKVNLPYARFLGYEKGENGFPKIVPEEAETVRLIYKVFLGGKSIGTICSYLESQGILSPGGKTNWTWNTVDSILSNEKYCGNAILQKRFTVDFLTKKQQENNGEFPRYFVKNSHEAIIPIETFELTQVERKRRNENNIIRGSHVFSGIIFCADCGNTYTSKVWHSTSKYRRTVWQCSKKFTKGQEICSTPHFSEEQLKGYFVVAFNKVLENKGEILEALNEIIQQITDTTELDKISLDAQDGIGVVAELLKKHICDNATTQIDQKKYQNEYDKLVTRYEATKARLLATDKQRENLKAKKLEVEHFMDILKSRDALIEEFDDDLFAHTIQRVTIISEKKIVFTFRHGEEFTLDI